MSAVLNRRKFQKNASLKRIQAAGHDGSNSIPTDFAPSTTHFLGHRPIIGLPVCVQCREIGC
ncbi:hypothetical protein RE6C_04704 [Rhodopirellula europaea 6C]|uniref:Uncharacterized protein n=1 Tax=Rhodopirellula europaea 6C TaxID=1263867 RepID=M2ANI1_9BACT|nr:hypothetical protein RE6C_04704 [Rhodopirellula europaea 6C]